MQGVQILRVHDVNEINQSIKVFNFSNFKMLKKYFGTDGIRGKVNQYKINGEMFFKFGLAAGTYFKNQKNKTNSNNRKRHKIVRLYTRASISIWFNLSWNARLYTWTLAN